jgi:hypothetical protein
VSDFVLTDDQRDVLEPVQAIVRALPPEERPELIEALVGQFVAVFRQDWPERGEDEVQRYGDLVRASLGNALGDKVSPA